MGGATQFRIISTYDPFLVFEEELKLLRLGQRPPAPTSRQAVVLSGGPATVVVRVGERVPGWLLGNHRYLYKLDLGEHTLELECRLPTRDGAFVFQAHLTYTASVDDPAKMVKSGIRDVAAVIAPYLMRKMRDAAIDFDAGEVGPAERKINAELEGAVGDRGIALHSCLVQLTIDDDEGAGVREHRRTLMEMSNREMRFRQYEAFLRDGDTKLLTLHLAEHPDDAGALYDMLRQREGEESDRLLQTLKVVLNGSDGDEDFEIDEGRRRMVRSLFDRAAPDGMSPMRRVSASRVRGTLTGGRAPAPADPAPARDPEKPTVDGEAHAEPPERKSSRVRPMRDPDAE